MSNTTTQDNFTVLKGHINDGQNILMNNGDTFTIKADLKGWLLFSSCGRQIEGLFTSGYNLEYTIVNFKYT